MCGPLLLGVRPVDHYTLHLTDRYYKTLVYWVLHSGASIIMYFSVCTASQRCILSNTLHCVLHIERREWHIVIRCARHWQWMTHWSHLMHSKCVCYGSDESPTASKRLSKLTPLPFLYSDTTKDSCVVDACCIPTCSYFKLA